MQKLKIAVFFLGVLSLLLTSETTESYVKAVEASEPKPSVQEYSKEKVREVFGEEEWSYFDKIINAESKWEHKAKNPRSSAYGLCQTMLSLHKTPLEFMDDPYIQVDWCIGYVKNRYKTPQRASAFWDKNKWF